MAGGVADWTRRAFMPCIQMTDAAKVSGSFQETTSTAPRKTAKDTVKHHDGGVDSVIAKHRGGGESSVIVTTLNCLLCQVTAEHNIAIPVHFWLTYFTRLT